MGSFESSEMEIAAYGRSCAEPIFGSPGCHLFNTSHLGLVSQRRCSAFKAEDGASESPSRRLTSSADHGEFDRSAGRPHRTGVVALLSGIRRCRSETPNGLWPALGRLST